MTADVEIIPPHSHASEPRIHVAERAPGWFGAVLALLTVAAAFGVGAFFLVGRTLGASLLVWLTWPLVFSPQFTSWVFGAERIVFWKILVVFLVVDIIARLFLRRDLWPRR